MGSFGLWYWLVLILIVFVPAMVIGLTIWLAGQRATTTPNSANKPRRRLLMASPSAL